MKYTRTFWLVPWLLFLFNLANAQEGGVANSCRDGIDNDGDGFVDCFDSQCTGTTDCKDFYIGIDASCEVEPTNFPRFYMREAWRSNGPEFWGSNHTVMGDFTGDGVPELFSMRRNDKVIYVYNGENGNHLHTIDIGRRFGLFMALGDAEPDGCPELFVAARYGGQFYLVAFDCNYNLKWTSSDPIGGTNKGAESIGIPGVADFDFDGTPEVYVKNQIFNAQTGAMLAKDNSVTWTHQNAGAVAADFLPDGACSECDGLELLVGDKVYSVNTGTGLAGTGSVQMERTMPNYTARNNLLGDNNNHTTSIADLDLDGDIDALVIGTDSIDDEKTVIYYWDIQSPDMFSQVIRDKSMFGAGRINIGDLDGDGYPDFSLNNIDLYAFTIDFAGRKFDKLWERNHSDASGFTGTALFDFNGDGRSEMVYRDMDYLYVLDGLTGNLALPAEIPCYSGTYADYPIVGDINGDGATEICVACNKGSGHGKNDNTGRFVLFEAAGGEKWMNSRRVWNQHGYFNVNINDDLSVPRTMQDHTKVFSSGVCSAGDNRPLNSFLNQSPYLDINGCPNFGAPDLTFDGNPQVFPPVCGQDTFHVSFGITNNGDAPYKRKLYVSFYDADPMSTGANKLNTDSVNISLDPGDSIYVDSLQVLGNGTSFNLYIFLNDPMSVLECVNTNNIANTLVDTSPFAVSAHKISDNFKCDPAAADNGNARAYIEIGGTEVTSGYTFTWMDAGSNILYTGTTFSGMAEGSYRVTARNDALACNSDTINISIDLLNSFPVVDIVQTEQVTNCQLPNGAAEAFVSENGVDASLDYEYTWFEGSTVFVNEHGKGKTASGLSERNYIVYAVNKNNGCSGTRLINVAGSLAYPEVNISSIDPILACDFPFGTLTAEASQAGVTGNDSNYTFIWYHGTTANPLQEIFNENNASIDSLAAGFYTVEVINDTSLCKSLAETAEITDNRPSFAVDIVLNNAFNSCIAPNGSLSASVSGNTSDYDFYWYRGNNTTVPIASPEATSGSNNSTAENLSDIIYTVRAVHKVSQCESTATYKVPRTLMTVTVSPSVVSHQTNCWPRNGELTAIGAGALSGTYEYYWFDNNPGADPDTTSADFTGQNYSGLRNGNYWVVAKDAVNGCLSAAVEIDVNSPAPLPDVAFSYTANATCDPAFPTGSATADVVGQPENNYHIRWYAGQTTNNSYRLPNTIVPTATVQGTDNETLANVPDQVFTVRIRDKVTNCTDTAVAVIPLGTPPTVSVSTGTTPVTVCLPPNGTASADVGGVSAGFTFEWYEGQHVKSVADYTGASQNNLREGWYTVVATDNATRCISDPVSDSVRYQPGFNIVDIQATQTVNNCFDSDGELEVMHTGGTGPYSYIWYRGNSLDPANQIGIEKSQPDIKQGLYTAFVMDSSNFCTDHDTMRLKSSDIVPILNASATGFNNCQTPDGTTFASVVGVPDQSQYSFFWFNGPSIKTDGSSDGFAEDHLGQGWNGLAAGEYTVIAKQNFGNQCESDEVIVEVNADAEAPVVSITGTANTHCTSPFNGELLAKAQTANGQPQPVNGYNFAWYQSDINNFIAANFISQQVQLSTGNDTIEHTLNDRNGGQPYAVIVTNQDTYCSDTVSYHLTNNLEFPYFTGHVKNDLIQCGTPGSIEITGLSYGLPSDFNYAWYQQDTTNALGETSPLLSNLDTGTYLVKAMDNLTRCESNPLEVAIEDLREYPTAMLSLVQAQTSIKPGYYTGVLAASAEEPDGTTELYNFGWFRNDFSNNVGNRSNVVVDTLFNQEQDQYFVVAENNVSNCSDTTRATIPFDPPEIAIINVLATDKTWCLPANGVLEVDSVTREGMSADLGSFDYFWYRDNYVNDLTAADYVTSSPVLNDLSEGTYFVVARDTNLHITSLPYQIEILDQSTIPTIELAGRTPQTSCDPNDTNHNGSLTLAIDNGAPVSDYNYEWYRGQDTLGTPISATTHQPSGLTMAYYSVQVTSLVTGCKNQATYFVPDSIPPVNVILSANANTNCDNFNGSVFANVLNRNQDTFEFFWFEGSSADAIANADYTGAGVNNLPGGDYTLVVQDTIERSCLTTPQAIRVDDILEYPEFTTSTTSASNCDPLLPNGKAQVLLGDSLGSYQITWTVLPGTDTTAINDQVTQMTPADYGISVFNRSNYCFSHDTLTIDHQPEILPDPLIEIVSHMTHCAQPNGVLKANYIYNIMDYQVNWYDGSQAAASPDFSGNPYGGLDIGTYGLKLVSKITGCETNLVEENIEDRRVYPEYQLETTYATCEESNGAARLIPVIPDWFYQVDWETPSGTVNGLAITNQAAGEYPFIITTDQACTTSGNATIINNIEIFNGVSANQDGMNDWFILDCIENYPRNAVKIFNRAGDLVFEKQGYDNAANVFTGLGNRGLYLGEKELPVGTYFYIIDLKDGSELKTGYLELVR